MAGLVRRLAAVLPDYAKIAWWGLVGPRTGDDTLVVCQAVILSSDSERESQDDQVLLAVRRDLRGWELPGGTPVPGESPEETLRREVLEETGCEVSVERHVGDYIRSGFRPHTARVYLCRVRSGNPRPSSETPRVGWFSTCDLPETIFPWFRRPLSDALLAATEIFEVREHQGLDAVLVGMSIDLRMRISDDRAR